MRFRLVLVGVFVAVLLFAVPVMGLRADSGAPVGGPVSSGSTDGTAELGFIGVIGSNGASVAAIDEGSYLWGANAGPEALPQTGVDLGGQTGQDQRAILDGIAGGVRNVTELLPQELAQTAVNDGAAQCVQVSDINDPDGFYSHGCDNAGALPATTAPSALPATGRWDDGIFVPSNLPAPGETELTIGELAPSALPVTGTSAQSTGCAQFWGMTVPDGFYSHGCDNGALPGTTAPSALPQSGVGAQSSGCAQFWGMTTRRVLQP